MLRSLATSKPTVNDDDMKKLDKFTMDFGQEGWVSYKCSNKWDKNGLILTSSIFQWIKTWFFFLEIKLFSPTLYLIIMLSLSSIHIIYKLFIFNILSRYYVIINHLILIFNQFLYILYSFIGVLLILAIIYQSFSETD